MTAPYTRIHPGRVTPPFTTDRRWAELTEACRRLDFWANESDPERRFDVPPSLSESAATVDSTYEMTPALRKQPGVLDGSPKEATDMTHATRCVNPAHDEAH